MAGISASEFNRRIREAQRKAEQDLQRRLRDAQNQVKREVERINSQNQRTVDAYTRKVEAHNRKVISDHNSAVKQHNQKAETHNKKAIEEINRRLRSATSTVQYTDAERHLADRVHEAAAAIDSREYDSFLSYARIDGAGVAGELRQCLDDLGVAVWFDEVAIIPGRSQALQMDAGLRKARTGIALLTPAYLVGRFWTERELGALLSKKTLIPVLHNVTFEQVAQYSGILPDLAGFTTARDSIDDIAQKIAAAVLVHSS